MRPAAIIRFISTARRTFVCLSSGLRSPRSAKTLPDPGMTAGLFFLFSMSHLVIFLGLLKPPADEFHVSFGCFDTLWRFLLEDMQYIHSACESHRIDSPVCVPAMVLNN